MQVQLGADSMPLRIVTYNLRYDSQPDKITVRQSLDRLPDPLTGPGYFRKRGEQPWSLRRLRVVEQLLGEGIVLAGFQEALVRQVHDLAEPFGADWDWVGVGRDDGVEAGEYSPIFYKKSELVLLSYDSFWTSNTSFEPSRFPGAGSHRVCITLHLKRRTDGKKFTVLNTHMDDRSEAQRRHAASMILARAGPCSFSHSPPDGRDSGAYEIATGVRAPSALPTDFSARFPLPADAPPRPFVLHDLRAHTPRRVVSANHATFTGFDAPNDTHAWNCIDFVFGGANGAYALSHDGVLASDHRPVLANVRI
ncbi:Endonuclease/exonuclease/phosphatase [Mycena rosella]|uniref:Endonuclease/exonuclease/phosphatase n=1 Tax=Mycena rosella TaxID=1033263 RepID=A0AAD7B334_MYCRO|nr:Endonuclease/exonuclease/phosphatase [Mycena rosella]